MDYSQFVIPYAQGCSQAEADEVVASPASAK